MPLAGTPEDLSGSSLALKRRALTIGRTGNGDCGDTTSSFRSQGAPAETLEHERQKLRMPLPLSVRDSDALVDLFQTNVDEASRFRKRDPTAGHMNGRRKSDLGLHADPRRTEDLAHRIGRSGEPRGPTVR